MKIKHLLPVALAVVFSSCSTAYRSGQTPDDVYYSPAPEAPAYSNSNKDPYLTSNSDQQRNSYNYRNQEPGIENPAYSNSITFGMGIGNPLMYPFDDLYNPFYSPYAYNFYPNTFGFSPYGLKGMYSPYYNYGYNAFGYNDFGFYNPYSLFNPYSFGYSPYVFSSYYSPGFYVGKNVNTNTGARKYNLNAYNNLYRTGVTGTAPQPIRTIGTTQPNNGISQPGRTTTGTTAPVRSTGVGNVIRRVFTPSSRTYNNPNSRTYNNNSRVYNNNSENTRVYNNDNNTRTYSQPERSYSAPSSSSGSNSSSAPVRTFRR